MCGDIQEEENGLLIWVGLFRMHKKGITEEVAKKRSRKNVKVQVGLFFGFNQVIAGMKTRWRDSEKLDESEYVGWRRVSRRDAWKNNEGTRFLKTFADLALAWYRWCRPCFHPR